VLRYGWRNWVSTSKLWTDDLIKKEKGKPMGKALTPVNEA
jgi:hypothetical protein